MSTPYHKDVHTTPLPVCLEYLDDLACMREGSSSGSGKAPRLLSLDPFERAKQRVDAAHVNQRLCSPYYDILVRRGKGERRAHFQSLLEALRELSGRMGEGPFIGGDDMSLVDCTLLPHR